MAGTDLKLLTWRTSRCEYKDAQWWMARLGGSEGATGGDEVSCQPDNAITGSSKQTSKANGFDVKASLFPDVIGEVRLFTGPS